MDVKEILVEKIKKWIKETNIIDYDEEYDSLGWEKGFKVYDKKIETLRDNSQKEVYVVSFSTKDYIEYNKDGKIISLIEGMMCYAYYDAQSLELLYIQKKAGYIEVDGSF